MSSSLVWELVERKTNTLPDELKNVMRKKYGDPIETTILDCEDLAYLTGLADCEIKGAKELIDAIETYGEIAITEEF